jgi:hypothetical protein
MLGKPRERPSPVLYLNLGRKFKPRVLSAIGFVQRAAANAATALERPRVGVPAALGAVALGVVLMAANIAHDHRGADVAVVPSPVKAFVAVAPKPDPISIAVAPSPTPVPEKSTARVDTTPTGAIAEAPPVKAKHKKHPRKLKELDSDR